MNWTELDWAALDRLRAGFLAESQASEPYWTSESALASYDATYGERIGWKWDQVLRELEMRSWQLSASAEPTADKAVGTVLDWGCGSGIASRRVISRFGAARFGELVLWDHSPLAVEFAAAQAAKSFPVLKIAQATDSFLEGDSAIDLVVVSHVLNELPDEALAGLRRVLARAQAAIWVESGTSAVSRQLGRIRDELAATHRIVAPCTHQLGCPMFAPGNERHWCHFFAPPPTGIFADGNWVKFGQRAGIDLRSLPYSFFAIERRLVQDTSPTGRGLPQPVGSVSCTDRLPLSRLIGRPEHFKAFVRFLNCDERGLTEAEIAKRQDPALYKSLDKTKDPLVLQWEDGSPRLLP